MPTEQRVISSKPKPAAKAAIGEAKGKTTPKKDADKAPGKSRKGLIIALVVLLVAALAAVAYLVLNPKAPAAATAKAGTSAVASSSGPAPVEGDVVAVDAMTVNLADGRFLRLGFSIQLSKEMKTKPDTGFAADKAIALWSGRTVAEVADPATRDQLKAQLLKDLTDRYGARNVLAVYLTNYVSQ